jgi:DNA-binding MarR family transcriptional regulator
MNKAELIQEIIENLAKCQRPAFNSGWKATGLSHAQLGMLYMIFYHREVSPKDIADYLGVSKSAVTQLMEPLVDKELVSRRNDIHDRRVVRLSLSAKGQKFLHQLNKYKYAGIRSALDSLDTKDLEQLNTLHQKMLIGIK